MPEDKNVNIKLELSRDNNGKLKIIARFNSKAPNIIIDKNEYIWVPTLEEKDLINEAFGFISSEKPSNTPDLASKEEIDSKVEEETNIESNVETVFEKEPELETKEQKPEEIHSEPSVFEKLKGDSVFESENNDRLESNEIKETVNKDDMEPKIDVKKDEESPDKDDNKIDENEDLIVDADEEAIREALKKHEKDDDKLDESMREVDEKTIIDRVLSQKKKGKWSKK